MAYMYVDIDLSEVDDDELIEELKIRGYDIRDKEVSESNEFLEKIYHLRRTGKSYESELDTYIFDTLGRVL